MKTIDAIQQRRAVKHYDPKHDMTQQEITQLMELAKLSPTAYNQQNSRFVIVSDKALRAKVRDAAWDQAQVTEASLLIILCADLKAWEKQPAQYWDNAPQAVQDFMLPAMDQYYRNKEQVQRDEAMRSTGIAAQTIMLAAKAMGYDSCPMDGFDYDAVGELINLPDDHTVAMFVVVGKATKPAWKRPSQTPIDASVINNHF